MNANDLPPAARLACLIEAGVAANPDLKQGRHDFLVEDGACVLGFACLGAGLSRRQVERLEGFNEAADALNVPFKMWDPGSLLKRVATMNDEGWAIAGIVNDLRVGELALVTA